jgi:hypothetical protein
VYGAAVVTTGVAVVTIGAGVVLAGCLVHGAFAFASITAALAVWLDSAAATTTSLKIVLLDSIVGSGHEMGWLG